MQRSLLFRLTLVGILITLIFGGGVGVLFLNRGAMFIEEASIDRNRVLAQVLAGLRKNDGALDFRAINSFVESADQVDLGLVYAIECNERGEFRRGVINPRVFARLRARYKRLMLQGRHYVLKRLSAGKIERQGKIKEAKLSVPGGTLRLGFELEHLDKKLKEYNKIGRVLLILLLFVGFSLVWFAAVIVSRPIRKLAESMTSVVRGDSPQLEEVPRPRELATMTYAFNTLNRSIRDEADLRQNLRPYFSTEIMERILKEDNPLELAAEEQPVTVLCGSLRGLSILNGKMKALDGLRLLNEYFAPVIDAIVKYQGVVVTIDGPRLICVWGIPIPVKEPELNAIRAANAARTAVQLESRRQDTMGGEILDLGIGIATGRAAAGNLGSSKRATYLVYGGPVDMAMHIERMAQPGDILVNETAFSKVRHQVQGAACSPLMLDELDEAVPLYRLEANLNLSRRNY